MYKISLNTLFQCSLCLYELILHCWNNWPHYLVKQTVSVAANYQAEQISGKVLLECCYRLSPSSTCISQLPVMSNNIIGRQISVVERKTTAVQLLTSSEKFYNSEKNFFFPKLILKTVWFTDVLLNVAVTSGKYIYWMLMNCGNKIKL